ncbi:uncharacterized protein LOC124914635 [Impatiens glandulifera]|uniref:uncharacterized protein LOC124914635 n=1 Tax=Impatiens glandulifera TaxID=253017 RepID=UPI001FB0FAE9|nr:uncharacterized protein LOC124914635 [Impatiens glandulifera]
MNGKEVQCPNGGPLFKLQVELARPPPMEKKGKRSRDDSERKPAKKIPSHLKSSTYNQILGSSHSNISRAHELHYLRNEAAATDTYEAALASLPFSVKERFLRILRLGIATHYDLDIHSLTSLIQLPQQIAITVLDQFMLSGADKSNKGEYLARLIAKHPRAGDMLINEVQVPSYSARYHLPVADPNFSRYESSLTGGRYSSSVYSQPQSSGYSSRIEEDGSLMYQSARSSSVSYNTLNMDPSLQATAVNGGGHPSQPPPSRVRFDPFTGIPYKFDPFTGEPLPQNSPPLGFRSPY